MSVDVIFGSLADMTALSRDVRYTPKSGHGSERVECPKSARSRHRPNLLLDHVGRERKHRGRHSDTERLRGLQIDDQLELG